MKGRRHRLQYKKKVNPSLQVEVKPSMKQRKIHEEKLRKQQVRARARTHRIKDTELHVLYLVRLYVDLKLLLRTL